VRRVTLNIEKVWKWTAVTLAIIGLGGWIWSANLTFAYQARLPRHADPTTGNVYPLNVHGIVVYQTRDERNFLDDLQYSSIAVFVAGLLTGAIYKKRWGKPPAPPWLVESRKR
jgi:hypothetical protein